MLSRRAGQRRHFVALQSKAITTAGEGYTETWSTYANVWAAVRPAPATASERLAGGTTDTPITHRVELDYRSDVRPSHRVLFQETRPLYIRGMQNDDERNITWLLDCEERAQ